MMGTNKKTFKSKILIKFAERITAHKPRSI